MTYVSIRSTKRLSAWFELDLMFYLIGKSQIVRVFRKNFLVLLAETIYRVQLISFQMNTVNDYVYFKVEAFSENAS